MSSPSNKEQDSSTIVGFGGAAPEPEPKPAKTPSPKEKPVEAEDGA